MTLRIGLVNFVSENVLLTYLLILKQINYFFNNFSLRKNIYYDTLLFILFEYFFIGDYEKVRELDNRVTQLAGFQSSYSVTGQTYPRIVDAEVVSSLSILGSAVHKVNIKILFDFKIFIDYFNNYACLFYIDVY